jgi:glycosyltransferase involved in cell wall biosynthesis
MISVIIPLYNKAGSIAQALDSVLAQEYQDFEIVVVDDGSTDGGASVVENYGDARIRLVRQENAGVSAARNRGIEEARGEYVAFLDADDVWMPGFLSEIAALQREFPQCRAQATNYVFNSNGVKSPTILRKIPFSGERGVLTNYFEVASCSHPPVWTSAVCIERVLLQEIGGFPVGIKSGEDLLTWARVAVRTDWTYSMREMAQYNQGEGYDKKNLPPRRQDAGDPVGKELKRIYAEYSDTVGMRRYISHWHKMRASVAIRYGERVETLCEVLRSLRYNPLNFKVVLFAILAMLPVWIRRAIIAHG